MSSFVFKSDRKHCQRTTTGTLNTTALDTWELNRGEVEAYTWKKRTGAVSTGLIQGDVGGGVSIDVLHTTLRLGQKCLLTDWCLVTVMVGMGELSAWPLTEPRI